MPPPNRLAVVVLAAGFGKRFRSASTPKVLHPAAGETGAPTGSGHVSLGLQVPDLEVAVVELRQRGITFSPPAGSGGPRQTSYFADPDGTVLYLIQMEGGAR